MAFELLLAFDTQEPEFARGFEAGRVWQMLKGDEPFEQLMNAANAEMVMRMVEATGREYSADILDDEWIQLNVA